MKAALEGLLFISGDDGLEIKQIVDILQINLDEAKALIKELYSDYLKSDRGIQIEFLGGKFKLTTKREHSNYYEKLVSSEQEHKLSQAALEVLSIIAYNQPISRVQVDKIRGVSSVYVVRKLVLKNLIEECGRSDEAGRPMLYKTTDQFLNYFGLGSVKELPKINEVEIDNKDYNLFETRYKED